MKTQQRIYVTGAPRSGTTFLAKMLTTPVQVNYLHEPFNPYCGAPGINRLYLYIRPEDSTSIYYRELIKRVFNYNFTPKIGYFKEDKPWQVVAKSLIGSRSFWSQRFAKANPFHKTMVIKDPIGCLLTEYLAHNFDVKPVIIIRHPIAVVASAMRLGWKMNLDPIRDQQELIEDYFSDDHEFLFVKRTDPVEAAAALWRALNKVLLSQIRRNPSWTVVTHEVLCKDAMKTFRNLYDTFHLPWSRRMEKKLIRLTHEDNPVEAGKGQVHDFRRNSVGLFKHSIGTLSNEQRKKIIRITEDVALQVYSENLLKLDDGF